MINIIRVGAVLGSLAVVFGAFGAHTLKDLLTTDQLSSFETGVRYQFYHSFALIVCGLMAKNVLSPGLKRAAICFVSGIFFFSGSIYLLSTRSITGLDNISFLGPVTPIGGVLFIAGWIFLAIEAKNFGSK